VVARAPITKANPYPSRKYGRTFSTEREYRDFLAQRKGFASWEAQRRAPRTVRNAREEARLRPIEREARARALEARALMSREGLTLSQAATRAGTTPGTVLRYVGPALELRGHRYVARKADRLYRRMLVTSTRGVVAADVRGSNAARLIAQHANAVRRYLDGRAGPEALTRFRGKRVGGFELETDPEALEALARGGEFDFLDLYEHAA
jgi:hypothetical protein